MPRTGIVIAADIGLVVNPDGAKNQLEGGILQAVSLSLKEQVAFDRREITSRDWSDEVPSVEVILIGRSDPSLGAVKVRFHRLRLPWPTLSLTQPVAVSANFP